MSSTLHRIGVLLCTHNGETYLQAQLDSLMRQEKLPCAVFIHDWASQDRSREILRRFADENLGRLHVEVHHHNHAPGAHLSFVEGIRKCLASPVAFDYLALCDQDDVWSPTKLLRYAAAISEQVPPPDVLYSDVCIVDERERLVSGTFYGQAAAFRPPVQLRDSSLLLANPVVGMTMCMSRPFLEACAPALDGPWLMHDWALLLLAVSGGYTLSYVPSALALYRQHGNNALGAAQGLRLLERTMKASAHFALVRRQAEWLGDRAAGRIGTAAAGIARAGPAQRLHVARASLQSSLLNLPSRWLLACSAIMLW